jgi:hypothetical protein
MMDDIYQNLQGVILEMNDDVQKFYLNGNKAAGIRVRKQCQLIKALAQELRVDVLNIINESKETVKK